MEAGASAGAGSSSGFATTAGATAASSSSFLDSSLVASATTSSAGFAAAAGSSVVLAFAAAPTALGLAGLLAPGLDAADEAPGLVVAVLPAVGRAAPVEVLEVVGAGFVPGVVLDYNKGIV